MLTNGKEISAHMMLRAKGRTYVPAIYAIMGKEWEQEKILTDRATYLKASIEPLLLEVFKDKHDSLLPKFVTTKPAPPVTVGPDGKPVHLPGFNYAGMSVDDQNEIWAAIRRHSQNGKMDEAMIVRTERDWFNAGLNERELLVRVNYMRIYMDEHFIHTPRQISRIYTDGASISCSLTPESINRPTWIPTPAASRRKPLPTRGWRGDPENIITHRSVPGCPHPGALPRLGISG